LKHANFALRIMRLNRTHFLHSQHEAKISLTQQQQQLVTSKSNAIAGSSTSNSLRSTMYPSFLTGHDKLLTSVSVPEVSTRNTNSQEITSEAVKRLKIVGSFLDHVRFARLVEGLLDDFVRRQENRVDHVAWRERIKSAEEILHKEGRRITRVVGRHQLGRTRLSDLDKRCAIVSSSKERKRCRIPCAARAVQNFIAPLWAGVPRRRYEKPRPDFPIFHLHIWLSFRRRGFHIFAGGNNWRYPGAALRLISNMKQV